MAGAKNPRVHATNKLSLVDWGKDIRQMGTDGMLEGSLIVFGRTTTLLSQLLISQSQIQVFGWGYMARLQIPVSFRSSNHILDHIVLFAIWVGG
jgi:hypothetical protein